MPRKPDLDRGVVQAIVWRLEPRADLETIERTASGGSTQVYRFQAKQQPFFLRFGEELIDSMLPEAEIHRRLRRLGLNVPDVIAVEELVPEIERSVIVTTAIPGEAIENDLVAGVDCTAAVRAAGRACARIPSVAIDGFGFIDRSRPWSGVLAARDSDFSAWIDRAFDRFPIIESMLSNETARTVHDAFVAVREWNVSSAVLAHGDLDLSHLFVDHGAFSGLIDFGEACGADRWYDLAHLVVHTDVRDGAETLRAFVAGYHDIIPLGEAELELIRLRAMTLAAGRLIMIHGRGSGDYERQLVGSLTRLESAECLAGLRSTTCPR